MKNSTIITFLFFASTITLRINAVGSNRENRTVAIINFFGIIYVVFYALYELHNYYSKNKLMNSINEKQYNCLFRIVIFIIVILISFIIIYIILMNNCEVVYNNATWINDIMSILALCLSIEIENIKKVLKLIVNNFA